MKRKTILASSILLSAQFFVPIAYADFGSCSFSSETFAFKGTSLEQASCLLKAPKPFGNGARKQTIPEFLKVRIGNKLSGATSKFETYLTTLGLSAEDVGGSLELPLVKTQFPNGSSRQADYFVIHDTAYPLYLRANGFPPNIDDSTWNYGVNGWSGLAGKVNAIVDRQGKLRTFVDFGKRRPKIGMKLEKSSNIAAARNRFIHIENVQPRLKLKSDAKWGPYGPEPGFTKAQYHSLALYYVAASIRRGQWLIPAFHFNIDYPAKNTHNDPQNFDLKAWANSIQDVASKASMIEMAEIEKDEPAGVRHLTCQTKSHSVTLQRTSGKQTVKLPASGKFFGEGHYVTTLDTFPSGRKYPNRMNPQPSGYPEPYQCDENIRSHLQRSFKIYQKLDPTMTMKKLYPDRWAKWWTPEENGKCGQGSIGNTQLRTLTPDREMWFLTMNWASGHKPKRDTRFLLSANNRHVVVVAGYETGPGDDDKLGGVTREVHGWLRTKNSSEISVALLSDQSLELGPTSCR